MCSLSTQPDEADMELEENEEDMPRWQRRELQEKRLRLQNERELQRQVKDSQNYSQDSDETPKKREQNGLRGKLRESINSGSSPEGKTMSMLEELKSIQTANKNKLDKQVSLNLESENSPIQNNQYSPQLQTRSMLVGAQSLQTFSNDHKILILEPHPLPSAAKSSENCPTIQANQQNLQIPSLDLFFQKMQSEKQEKLKASPYHSPSPSPTSPFQFIHKNVKQVLEQEGYMVEEDNITDIRNELKKCQNDIVIQASKEYLSSQVSFSDSMSSELDNESDNEDDETEKYRQKLIKFQKDKALLQDTTKLKKQNLLKNDLNDRLRGQRNIQLRLPMGIPGSSQSKNNNQDQIGTEIGDLKNLKISKETPKRSGSLRASLGWNSYDSTKSKGFTSRDDDEEDTPVESKKNKNKIDPMFRLANQNKFGKQNTLEFSALEGISKSSSQENNIKGSQKYLTKEKSSEINDEEDEQDYEEDEDEEGNISNPSEKGTSSGKNSVSNQLDEQDNTMNQFKDYYCQEEAVIQGQKKFNDPSGDTFELKKTEEIEEMDSSQEGVKKSEKPRKIQEIMAHLKKPSTFFHYINMRESKRKRRASIEFSDIDESKPVSAPDLGEVEQGAVEQFQIDLNNLNIDKQSSSSLIESQELSACLETPPVSAKLIPQNLISPARRQSGFSQDDIGMNTSLKRKSSSPIRMKYQQLNQMGSTSLDSNRLSLSKHSGERSNPGSSYFNIFQVKQNPSAEDNLIEKEIINQVEINGDLQTTEDILKASSRYSVTPVEVIPSNNITNIPLNGNPLQLSESSGLNFSLGSFPLKIQSSTSPSSNILNQSNPSYPVSFSNTKYLSPSMKAFLADKNETKVDSASQQFDQNNLSPVAQRLQSSPLGSPLLSPSIGNGKGTTEGSQTILSASNIINSNTINYNKSISLKSIPDYEPHQKSPSLANISPTQFTYNQHTDTSKLVNPNRSPIFLASENHPVLGNDNISITQFSSENHTINSQSTSTISSTQPEFNTDTNIQEPLNHSSARKAQTLIQSAPPSKSNPNLSYTMTLKNNSNFTQSISNSPLIDEFHKVPTLSMLFPDNKNQIQVNQQF